VTEPMIVVRAKSHDADRLAPLFEAYWALPGREKSRRDAKPLRLSAISESGLPLGGPSNFRLSPVPEPTDAVEKRLFRPAV